jgi:catechol 2,3-dioxygenase-like lactoylglutathione lyase family enzyme
MPEYKKAYVTIMVEDLDKSVEFYNGLLGLYEDLRFGDSWAELTTKGLIIGLHPKKIGAPSGSVAAASSSTSTWQHPGMPGAPKTEGKAVHPPPPSVSIGFEVEDIRKTAKELEAKGIRFHFQENEVNILAFFMDPDGTPLYLTQVR